MRRSSTCQCPGRNYRDKGKRWVVLNRNESGRSLLRCQKCGWEWRSSRLYVANLPDHTKRDLSGMTDEDILRRLRAGSLRVDKRTGLVASFDWRHKRWRGPMSVLHRTIRGSTYRFVRVCHGSKQKKVAVHRLVWMAEHGIVPPEGYDVHHKEPDAEYPDGIDNLCLVPSSINRSRDVGEEW